MCLFANEQKGHQRMRAYMTSEFDCVWLLVVMVLLKGA